MSNAWVCQFDGSLQCLDVAGESLEDMKARLAGLIGADNIVNAETRTRAMPRLCGLPTGVEHAFEITPTGEWALFHGTRGPDGFAYCCDANSEPEKADEPSLADILQSADLSSATANPVLVRELVGRPVRCYNQGDMITMDYRPERVNIVERNGRIVRIWFG